MKSSAVLSAFGIILLLGVTTILRSRVNQDVPGQYPATTLSDISNPRIVPVDVMDLSAISQQIIQEQAMRHAVSKSFIPSRLLQPHSLARTSREIDSSDDKDEDRDNEKDENLQQQFTQFLNILPADCSFTCMMSLNEAQQQCDGKILDCYECDGYVRPKHLRHMYENSIRNVMRSSSTQGYICVHVAKATIDDQKAAGPKFQSALSLPGPCDFRTRSTLFKGVTLFTSRCTCIGETQSWENPVFTHPKLESCMMGVVQPLSALADMCHNGKIKSAEGVKEVQKEGCIKCGGNFAVNAFGYTVCNL